MHDNKETVSEANVEKIFSAVGVGNKCKFKMSAGNEPTSHQGLLQTYNVSKRKFTVMMYHPGSGNYDVEFNMNELVSIEKSAV
ncbi:hypothetical protein [Pseudomonas sp. LB1P83]